MYIYMQDLLIFGGLGAEGAEIEPPGLPRAHGRPATLIFDVGWGTTRGHLRAQRN